MLLNMAGAEALLVVLHGGDGGAQVTQGGCDLCRNVTWKDALAGGTPGVP